MSQEENIIRIHGVDRKVIKDFVNKGGKMIFVLDSEDSVWRERIWLNRATIVTLTDEIKFFEGNLFSVNSFGLNTEEWHDIPKPQMRDMTAREIAEFCQSNGVMLCESYINGDVFYSSSIENKELDLEHYRYLENKELKKFPQVEVKDEV